MRRSRTAVALAGGVLAALLAPLATAAPAVAGPRPDPGRECTLTHATISATARPHAPLTDLFTTYADAGAGWTGADSTYSVPLRDGRLVWIFSDTFLGPVAEDGSRPEDTPFLNNSLLVQDWGHLRTVTGGTRQEPTSLVGPTDDADWHWFGAGLPTPSGDLQVGVLGFDRLGEGQWDWEWSHNSLATIDTETWDVTDLAPLPSEAGVQWASWYARTGPGGTVYVYGVEDLGEEKYLHVAKVLGGDLTDPDTWRYWDGTGWTRQETGSARVLPDVANEYSVTPYRDGYLLITQDTSEPFSPAVEAYVACSPQGPFRHATTLFDMPEVGPEGSYGNPNVIGYNAHEHPELRSEDTLTVTYNVNSLQNTDLYDDVSIYRPRFVEVTLDVEP
ncbi:DUF4185 domain-containing protein [Georgenia alba]|uniref:DUF4185 domain-containing protein n=1 Tax=Georgenia alba TaxID=2233858 RepID=A0ABW2QAQ3_9MICO